MDGIEEARSLLFQHRYSDAAAAIDRMLMEKPNDDELWYLRGVVSLKLKNYDAAQECFERALVLGRKSKYYQIKGMAHFELFEVEEAIKAFTEALAIEPEDATTNFFLSLCFMFQDDPRAGDFIKKAKAADRKKTAQLLLNFYTLFIREDPKVSQATKSRLEQRLKELRG